MSLLTEAADRLVQHYADIDLLGEFAIEYLDEHKLSRHEHSSIQLFVKGDHTLEVGYKELNQGILVEKLVSINLEDYIEEK